MSQNWISAIQAALTFMQLVNTGIATLQNVPPLVPILLSAAVGAGQVFMQRLGNMSTPPVQKG